MSQIEIVDVTPRDGFQAVVPFIPTETKIAVCDSLLAAGVRRLEIGAFVSPKAIPQMADIRQVLTAVGTPNDVRLSVLVPNSKGALLALSAGIDDIVFVLSVSESHNRSNVGRAPDESFNDLDHLMRSAPRPFRLRLNLATSFDCPFEGRIDEDRVMAFVDRALSLKSDIEFGLCDTTGRAFPDQVYTVMHRLMESFAGPDVSFAFHGHDTYGLGIANALAAYHAGTRIFDAATGGLGGCPFAPGATGNTATEDLVFTFENMGVATGLQLDRLLAAADRIVTIPGATIGGHTRTLPRARVLAAGPA